MQTAVYLSNRVPHAALGNITLYRALYGKHANLGHLREIGARAFVHVETHTRKLDPKAWEGRLCGYSRPRLKDARVKSTPRVTAEICFRSMVPRDCKYIGGGWSFHLTAPPEHVDSPLSTEHRERGLLLHLLSAGTV